LALDVAAAALGNLRHEAVTTLGESASEEVIRQFMMDALQTS